MSISPPAQQQITPPGPFINSTTNPQDVEQYARFMGMLRDIRAEVQNLRRVMIRLQVSEEIEDPLVRAQEILNIVEKRREIYTYNRQQIENRINELRALIVATPMLYDRFGDEVTHIENFWERVTFDWPPDISTIPIEQPEEDENPLDENMQTMLKSQFVLRRAQETIVNLDNIIYHAALLSIPGRLNQHLEQLRIGQALDFDATFVDEVDKPEDRRKILEYLSARPMVVQNGIIDAANGMVYHASSNAWRRRLSYLYILLAIAVGALLSLLVANAQEWFGINDFFIESGRRNELLTGYVFVILGGVIHLGVDALKQARGSGTETHSRALIAIEDWLLWVHINELGILMGIFSLWVGFFGLLTITETITWQTAFFVGYSIDSFIDLFLERFNTTKTAKNTLITAQINTP